MRRLKTIFAEVFGLFVDDSRFALAIIVWLGAIWLGLMRLNLPAAWNGVILFAGLAAILAESAIRTAGGKPIARGETSS